YATATRPASIFSSTLVDAQDGISTESLDLVTAAGEAVASAQHIPEGWSFKGLTTRNPSRLEDRRYQRPTVAESVDHAMLDYGGVLSGAAQVGSVRSSTFGVDVETTTKLHADVEQSVSVSWALNAGRLTQTTVENDTFTTIRTLDASKRVVQFEDEAQ